MGGNIFQNSRRYLKEEYFELESTVINKLFYCIFNEKFYNKKLDINVLEYIHPIKAYKNKKTFGDMDICISSEHLKHNWIESIIDAFNLNYITQDDWKKNSNVFSFLYNSFQIDLIICNPNEFQTSINYYAYNDLNNLVGRISKKLGLKFGHRGLEFVFKNNDNVLGSINLTKDLKTIYELLDLNYNEYLNGFNELDDMFVWISNSKYFNKDIFLLHNRNATSRVRDKKRATYTTFLLWCDSREFKNNYPYKIITEFGGYNIRQPFFDDLICVQFPQAREFYNSTIEKYVLNLKFKEKFNGNICTQLTGLIGKNLGAFMSWARTQINNNNMNRVFINYKEHTCNAVIRSLYHHYINNQEWLKFDYQLAVQIARNEGLVK